MIDSNNISDDCTYTISDEVREKFNIFMKIGIYKELHNKKLISDDQLNRLICFE